MIIKRGDIFVANFDPILGSEQGKTRPCLVIQNDTGNALSPTTIVAAITSKVGLDYPFTVRVEKGEGGLPKESTILLNQIRTVSAEHRLGKKLGSISQETMQKVDSALKASLALE
jgi:mRNA interferase MazF